MCFVLGILNTTYCFGTVMLIFNDICKWSHMHMISNLCVCVCACALAARPGSVDGQPIAVDIEPCDSVPCHLKKGQNYSIAITFVSGEN